MDEYEVFKSHFADISSEIKDPIWLANQLFQARLINRTVLEDVSGNELVKSKKTNILMRCVLSQIKLNAKNIITFIEILNKDKSTRERSVQLARECGLQGKLYNNEFKQYC